MLISVFSFLFKQMFCFISILKKKGEKSMQIKFRHEINVVYYENGA